MKPTSRKILQMEISPTQKVMRAPGWLAARRLLAWWRAVTGRVGIARRGKVLAVRETAALGDRRFVSVIQFERQRFLIGSSPSAITLLAQLTDESSGGESSGEKP
jgi:hypothetical protein